MLGILQIALESLPPYYAFTLVAKQIYTNYQLTQGYSFYIEEWFKGLYKETVHTLICSLSIKNFRSLIAQLLIMVPNSISDAEANTPYSRCIGEHNCGRTGGKLGLLKTGKNWFKSALD